MAAGQHRLSTSVQLQLYTVYSTLMYNTVQPGSSMDITKMKTREKHQVWK